MYKITGLKVIGGDIINEMKTDDDCTFITFIVNGNPDDIKCNIIKNTANCVIKYKNCYDNTGVIISITNIKPMKYIFNFIKTYIVFRIDV